MIATETRRCCKTNRGATPHSDNCRHARTVPTYVNFDTIHDASGYAAKARKKAQDRRESSAYRLLSLAQSGGAGMFDLLMAAALRMGMVKAKIAARKKR